MNQEQKQKDAIARMRKGYWNALRKMQFCEPGGKDYDITKAMFGHTPARVLQSKSRKEFEQYLTENKLDRKGNPLQ